MPDLVAPATEAPEPGKRDMVAMEGMLDEILARYAFPPPVTTDNAQMLFGVLKRDMPPGTLVEVYVRTHASPCGHTGPTRGPVLGTSLGVEVYWFDSMTGIKRVVRS